MSSKIGIIVRREYMERVKKKSFIITTLLMPVLMLGMMCLPALLMNVNMTDKRQLAVIDNSGIIAGQLHDNDMVHFEQVNINPDSIRTHRSDYDGFLIIGSDILNNPAAATLYVNEASSLELESSIASQINNIIEDQRLESRDMTHIRQVLDQVKSDITLSTYRLDRDADQEMSTGLSYGIGLLMAIVLYMFLLMYGQMVMTSIIEEKNNRVLELVVTSIKPGQLMMGKIIGVGLVAVTQILLWGLLLVTLSAFMIPMFFSPETAAEIAAYNNGTLDAASASMGTDGLQALSMIGNPLYIATIFGYLMLFLIGGFLLYSALYAAIGSSVDNIQDGSQLQSFIIIPLIAGFILSTAIAANPTSTLATWLSIIPFTSPMVMMTRIPFGIPTWEIIVSLIVLYATFVAMVWFAAKVYRVGIFMHGKKPTIKQLIQWARYK